MGFGQFPSDQWHAFAFSVAENGEDAHALDLLCDPFGRVVQVGHDGAVACFAQTKQLIVLANQLGRKQTLETSQSEESQGLLERRTIEITSQKRGS